MRYNPLIFALDVPSPREAGYLIRMLQDTVGMFKVGLEYFIGNNGLDCFEDFPLYKSGIFLDLKLHDIPATVERAAKQVSACPHVSALTVHAQGGVDMMRAAREGGGGTRILAVTRLTSQSGVTVDEVVRAAVDARNAGCDGVVCSGWEASAVRQEVGVDFAVVVPGVRLDVHKNNDDQKRIVTPKIAMKNGANYMVVGRPIRDAEDPRNAAEEILKEAGYMTDST